MDFARKDAKFAKAQRVVAALRETHYFSTITTAEAIFLRWERESSIF
jgi:hypothetical protein